MLYEVITAQGDLVVAAGAEYRERARLGAAELHRPDHGVQLRVQRALGHDVDGGVDGRITSYNVCYTKL